MIKKVERTIILMLNEKEASWLKGLMQNPLGICLSEPEQSDDREMREMFWDILNDSAIGD